MLNSYSIAFREQVAQRLINDDEVSPLALSRCFWKVRLPFTENVLNHAKEHPDLFRHEKSLVHLTLLKMLEQPELVDLAWIEKITRDSAFAKEGFEAIARLRSPEFLPFLAEVIEGPAQARHYVGAANALGNYVSDEAAALLLIAARKTGMEGTRAMCLAQVEKIAALQDAEARWSTRNLAKATRETTVSKLMAFLQDDDATVRIEAIKGLGTWEALEAMPELIGLLKDGNADVSAAARATLAHLNQRD